MKNLKLLERQTQKVYEKHAKEFDLQRDKSLFEKKWLDLFLQNLKGKREVLDVGCGSGEPIAKYFIQKNITLVGIDYSKNMIEIARKRFPQESWHVLDMRELKLQQKFSGIIAWDSFFHLNHQDQRKTLELFAKHLLPAGILMFTAGPFHGEVLGKVNGQKVYHSSLSLAEYREKLNSLGLNLIHHQLNDQECGSRCVFLARKDKANNF